MGSLEKLIDRYCLIACRDLVYSLVRKTIRINTVRSDDQQIRLGRSKMGGDPDIPDGMSWPEPWNDISLSFLMQVDLAEIALMTPPELAIKEGMLYFFYISTQGTRGYKSNDKGSWAVMFHDGKDKGLIRTPNPYTEGKDGYTPCILSFTDDISLPHYDSELTDAFFNDKGGLTALFGDNGNHDKFCDLYLDFMESRALNGNAYVRNHQFFGHAVPNHGEMELDVQLASSGIDIRTSEYQNPSVMDLKKDMYKWRLLAQIDSDDNPGWRWGDGGKLYFWIKEEDLKENRFEDVWVIRQDR